MIPHSITQNQNLELTSCFFDVTAEHDPLAAIGCTFLCVVPFGPMFTASITICFHTFSIGLPVETALLKVTEATRIFSGKD